MRDSSGIRQTAPHTRGKPRQGKRTDTDVRQALELEATRYPDASAAAIHRAIARDPRYVGRVPEERTVRTLIRPIRRAQAEQAAQAAWDFWDDAMTPEDARIVLEYLTDAAGRGSDGEPVFAGVPPSREWARRYVRLMRAVPGLWPEVASMYVWASLARPVVLTEILTVTGLGNPKSRGEAAFALARAADAHRWASGDETAAPTRESSRPPGSE
jgi:hypothetical protein